MHLLASRFNTIDGDARYEVIRFDPEADPQSDTEENLWSTDPALDLGGDVFVSQAEVITRLDPATERRSRSPRTASSGDSAALAKMSEAAWS